MSEDDGYNAMSVEELADALRAKDKSMSSLRTQTKEFVSAQRAKEKELQEANDEYKAKLVRSPYHHQHRHQHSANQTSARDP